MPKLYLLEKASQCLSMLDTEDIHHIATAIEQIDDEKEAIRVLVEKRPGFMGRLKHLAFCNEEKVNQRPGYIPVQQFMNN